ncbi:response regulator [Paenibacillus endoradicis]|uniref:response regulator n=1 Tax=Paenibacillus endoradicis TaxID=2972487 RepID=UPI002158AE69|nr:response regulator [Paenibacillus endoradicis]MCR8660570.1 response regulator [Paenibacillus endoradicis]
MQLLLVDDEKLALMQLERMVRSVFAERGEPNVVIHSFQLVSEAIQFAKSNKLDVVFLDINMPEMSGLEAAELLQQLIPSIEIIFVTAYDEYAVQAFELNAMDYLLKPLSMQRLQKTMERLYSKLEIATSLLEVVVTSHRQSIYCMKKIRFQAVQSPIVYPKWRTAKAQELFAYLLHRRGEFVPKYKIMNMFSPELDKKRAMTQLYTVIYQIRKCLKESGIEVKIDNDSIQEGYCLRLEDTYVDVEAWEALVNELDEKDPQYYKKLEYCLEQYDGDYMEDYDYLWAESERERLRQLWMHHARQLLPYFYNECEWTKVLKLGDHLNQFSPYEFEYGVYMLEAYNQLGQYDRLKQYYEKQEQEMLDELDLPLPTEMVEWYEEWIISRKS